MASNLYSSTTELSTLGVRSLAFVLYTLASLFSLIPLDLQEFIAQFYYITYPILLVVLISVVSISTSALPKSLTSLLVSGKSLGFTFIGLSIIWLSDFGPRTHAFACKSESFVVTATDYYVIPQIVVMLMVLYLGLWLVGWAERSFLAGSLLMTTSLLCNMYALCMYIQVLDSQSSSSITKSTIPSEEASTLPSFWPMFTGVVSVIWSCINAEALTQCLFRVSFWSSLGILMWSFLLILWKILTAALSALES